jgi:hypothetical protein
MLERERFEVDFDGLSGRLSFMEIDVHAVGNRGSRNSCDDA